MSSLTPGMRLHDRYELAEPIGAGGMAQVWRATDLVLGRSVAVKTLDGRLALDPQLRAGARREAQAAAKLTHPHITAVHDYGELTFDDGRVVPFLVMELLTGQTLAHLMQNGPVPWEQASAIAGQIASALAAAHAQGVVHQDIKPANVMVTPTGAKILDFGIAAIRGRPGSPDWISGTPAYAPPERLRQAVPEPSADIFSLGVLVYEMATGRLPWPIETWEQAASVERTPPAPLPKSLPGKQILAALALDPARRPTAAQLAIEFGEAGGDPTALLPSGAPAQPPPTLISSQAFLAGSAKVPERSTQMYERTLVPPPPRRRSPHLAAAITLVVLLITLGMVFLSAAFLQSNGGNGVQAATPTQSPTAPAVSTPQPTAAPVSISEFVTLMRAAVEAAAVSGQISGDNVEKLRQRINEIAERDRRQRPKDTIKKLEDLRKEIADMAEDGDDEISRSVAAGLDALIAQAIAQAQRQ